MTLPLTELIDELDLIGGTLEVVGDKLRLTPDTIPPALVDRFREQKSAILKVARLPGWPSTMPVPFWLVELLTAFEPGVIRQARAQTCHDPDCGFVVAVEWHDTDGVLRWSCPRCGLASAVSDQDELCGRGPYSDRCDEIENLFA